MYLTTDADRVDPAKVLMASDAAQLSPEGISYSNSHWMPVTSGPIHFLELFSGSARLSQVAALSGLRVGRPVYRLSHRLRLESVIRPTASHVDH